MKQDKKEFIKKKIEVNMTFMLEEIYSEPAILADYRTRDLSFAGPILEILKKSSIVYAIGSGSSYNAAVYLSILLNRMEINSIPIFASEVNSLQFGNRKGVASVIFSQSGKSVDATESAKYLKSIGSRIIGVTNLDGSELSSISDISIHTRVGEEKSIPATKSHLGQILTSLQISLNGESQNLLDIFTKAEKGISLVLKDPTFVNDVAQPSKLKSVFLGSGLLYPVALESSLKFTETSSSLSIAYPTREFLHGPKQLLNKDWSVFMLSPNQGVENDLRNHAGRVFDVVSFLKERYQISIDDEVSGSIILLVFSQLLSYFTSIGLGINPDRPSKLSKVVE